MSGMLSVFASNTGALAADPAATPPLPEPTEVFSFTSEVGGGVEVRGIGPSLAGDTLNMSDGAAMAIRLRELHAAALASPTVGRSVDITNDPGVNDTERAVYVEADETPGSEAPGYFEVFASLGTSIRRRFSIETMTDIVREDPANPGALERLGL